MNADTQAVLMWFGVGAALGPAVVWGASMVGATWLALLGWI
jgi:hypothetical protein